MSDSPKKRPSKESSKLAELEVELKFLTDALQRERADAINVRRRAEEEKLKLASYYKALVIEEFLPFIDSFDKALEHRPKGEASKAVTDWLHGLDSAYKQLWQTLNSLGLERIKTVGEPFDPTYHEAVQMDHNGSGSHEVVIEEFMPGYLFGNEVLRHAMVKVALK